ncbi:MAG TPA: glycoside hydrolase family 172 protein [Actinophytocola sp.]|uniref:glycoside hydrolase family 172 protein n=1 Tax=Actinophytocola sp. TaxID=1872138 RepID=UPI002DDD3EFD|nr:glycoside hydrolase family 172 protein [Actinophytocola sp.]HEV2779372.1 glycoside hydrolase family 172 protein [Actinophytocola sp.]
MRVRSLLGSAVSMVLVVFGFAAAPAGAAAAAQPKGAMAVVDKGPVGWDVYRRWDRMAAMRPGAQTRQFSSFDRTGGNNDGFDGTYSCLRQSGDGCVIAERSGPGQIDSMWFTRDFGSMVRTGRIKVELDGITVLDAPLQDVVDGRLGAPFVWPLVGNGDDTAGGAVIKVPMPYRESMRVTTAANPLFYHVTYREFADADGVSTFDPRDPAQDVVDRLRAYGLRDPKSPAGPAVSTVEDARAAGSWSVALAGSGWINQVRVRIPSVVASPRVGDDGRAFGAGGSSTFRIAVDPRNQGVRISRRLDPHIGQQRARLIVDGQQVGTWDSGAAQPIGGWANQTIEVPAALAAGKSRLSVRNEFISSSLDVNEFRYDVHSRVNGDWLRTDVVDVGPGHPGDERAHDYAITAQNWQGYRVFRYPVDAAELTRSDAVLAGARLRITFDGQTTVDAPIGEFFGGSGLGEYDTRTLMSAMDTAPDGWYTSWWPMPFAESATVALVNDSGVPIGDVSIEATFAADPSVGAALRAGALGYFHATHQPMAHTVDGRDWTFLEATGQGVFYGVTHTMRGDIPSGNRRNYLEGDERVYVDGARTPTLHGTGTEDFYESGWYFRDGTTYTMPLAGNPAYELDGDGCRYDCTGAYRLMLGDAVSFSSALRFDIEHGPANDAPAFYSSTAYWYGTPAVLLTETDLLDVSDDASRAAHDYRATGETRAALQSTFEGRNDRLPVSHGVASATGPIEFTLTTRRDNAGVRLLRMSDQSTGYQRADVYLGDTLVGEWLQPLANPHSRWLEDTFELPAALTAGKSTLAIRIVPSPGSPPWSAAQYRVLTRAAN